MPLRVGRALVLALVGGAATLVCWWLLLILFWMPSRRVHDVEGVFVAMLGPIIVSVVFLLTALAVANFERHRFENGQALPSAWSRILFFGLCPAAIMFALINLPDLNAWRFPLSETSVGLIGLVLGYVWVLSRRADELPQSGAGSPTAI